MWQRIMAKSGIYVTRHKGVHHLLGRALGQAIRPSTQRHRCVPPRPIRAAGDTRGPGCTRGLAAIGAHPLMPLLCGAHRLDRRYLDHVMTQRRGVVSPEGRVAAVTLLGCEDDHLIHFFHRHQGARMARVTRLPPTTALTPRATWALRLRRIARRRTGGIAGGVVELLL